MRPEHSENGENGQSGHDDQASRQRAAAMLYQTVGDFLSNTSRFKIIESTLREGEQFANAFFDTETKVKMCVAWVWMCYWQSRLILKCYWK
jgi:homocitrate synthase